MNIHAINGADRVSNSASGFPRRFIKTPIGSPTEIPRITADTVSHTKETTASMMFVSAPRMAGMSIIMTIVVTIVSSNPDSTFTIVSVSLLASVVSTVEDTAIGSFGESIVASVRAGSRPNQGKMRERERPRTAIFRRTPRVAMRKPVAI